MEIVDRTRMCKTIYEELYERKVKKGECVRNIVDCTAHGNPFPTNLDRDPPAAGGGPPKSQKDVLKQALEEEVGLLEFGIRLDAHSLKRRTH